MPRCPSPVGAVLEAVLPQLTPSNHTRRFRSDRVPALGFTLTEMAIVLGVIGTILGAIWTAAANVSAHNKAAKEVQEILTIVNNVRAFYANRASFAAGGTCLNAVLVPAGIFPADMAVPAIATDTCGAVNGTSQADPWDKTVDVGTQTSWDGLPGSTGAFEILIDWSANDMTTAQCSQVLTALTGSSAAAAGMTAVGGGGFGALVGAPAVAASNPANFSACSGHFTLQYSLK